MLVLIQERLPGLTSRTSVAYVPAVLQGKKICRGMESMENPGVEMQDDQKPGMMRIYLPEEKQSDTFGPPYTSIESPNEHGATEAGQVA